MPARGRRGLALRTPPPEAPPAPEALSFDDTQMLNTGLARHGPGLYHGLTSWDGAGTITVYNGTDATGTVIHTVVEPTEGVFYPAPSAPVDCSSVWVVQGARTVDYRID